MPANLDQRVTALERELADLKSQMARLAQPKDWRSVVGMFRDDDEVMKRMDAAVLAIREKDREKARLRYSKKRRAKAKS